MNQIDQKDLQWFVVQTKPNNERRVETNLVNQEIEIFLPMYETFQSCGGKMIQHIRPLFPNYVFTRFDLNLHYSRVRWTRGVNKILGDGVQPLPVSDRVVEMIKDRSGGGNLVKLEEDWKEGDPIQIRSGIFKDLSGVFQKKISDRGRVRILLNLIGVEVPVQISKWQLKKVA
jgi:transcriptional antiterminator RfaH